MNLYVSLLAISVCAVVTGLKWITYRLFHMHKKLCFQGGPETNIYLYYDTSF